MYTLYGRDCREEEKKTKHGEMRWTKTVKIATSEIYFLNIEIEFHYTLKNFFA